MPKSKTLVFFALVSLFAFASACFSTQKASATSACIPGGQSDPCDSLCGCKANSTLTCIRKKCQCGLNSQGIFGHKCDINCPCKTSLGLICKSGKCECSNAISQIWDNECVTLTADLCNEFFDADIPQFVDDATKLDWRCNNYKATYYTPYYNQTTGVGKYMLITTPQEDGYTQKTKCRGFNMERIMGKPDKNVIAFMEKLGCTNIYIGVSLEPGKSRYYHDNGEEFTETIADSQLLPCVYINSPVGGPATFTSAECTTSTQYFCATY